MKNKTCERGCHLEETRSRLQNVVPRKETWSYALGFHKGVEVIFRKEILVAPTMFMVQL